MAEFIGDSGKLELAADLRGVSDEFMQRLDRLHELEVRKRELQPDKPEFVRLARQIEDLARSLLHVGGQQVELAEEVHREAKADSAVDQPIGDTPPRRDVLAVLAEWRAAERRLSAAAGGSEEEASAQRDVERFRAEYREITDQSRRDA